MKKITKSYRQALYDTVARICDELDIELIIKNKNNTPLDQATIDCVYHIFTMGVLSHDLKKLIDENKHDK